MNSLEIMIRGCKSSIFVMGNSSYMILYHDCVVSENYLPFQLSVVDKSFPQFLYEESVRVSHHT